MSIIKLNSFISFSSIVLSMSSVSIAQKQGINQIRWNVEAQLPSAEQAGAQLGLAGALSGIHNDVLIIAGGANFPDGMPWVGGRKRYHDEVYILKKGVDGRLKSMGQRYKLPFPTAYGASCSTPEGVIYAGGENDEGPGCNVLLLKWDKAVGQLVIRNLPPLKVPLSNASIASSGSKVFIVGGETRDSVSTAFEMLDLDQPSEGWKELPPVPQPVSHGVAVMQEAGDRSCLFLLGGRKKNTARSSTFYNTTYKFDFESDKWVQKRSLPSRLSAGTGVAMGKNQILMFGGDKGDTFNRTEELILSIGREKDEIKKDELNRQKISLQVNHPGFSREILQYDIAADKWKVLGTIPFESPVTTNAVKWGHSIIIPSGEIKAGVRTPHILVGEIK